MKRHYIIIDTQDQDKVNWRYVWPKRFFDTNKNSDGSKFIVRYYGDQPDFVYDITGDAVGLPEYTIDQIHEVMNDLKWDQH